MKIFRLFILSILILFLVVTAISLLIPSHVRISRAANIRATAAEVWQQVDDMRSWSQWNPFFAQVAPGEIGYGDTSGGKLPAMKIGATLIEMKERKSDERVFVMQVEGKKQVLNGWRFINQAGSDSATLQCYIDFNLRWYPWEKFASLLFEKSYGVQMEQGLNNIKKNVEKRRTSFY